MKRNGRPKNNVKIADLQQELHLSDDALRRILREVRIVLEEGQKNLDGNEVGRIRQFLKEQRRREELRRQTIALPSIIKVQGLAAKLGVPVGEVLAALLKNGVMATLNDDLDYETAAIIGNDLGYNTEESVAELEADVLTPEKLEEILKKEDPTQAVPRPAVVTVMGHVDHGKTTLLDSIRETNVASQEAGGITQTISSYQVKYKGRTITFIDTPGHETFTFMRQRGVSLADVTILVVAADDGVKPQTKEAVAHARAANIPIIVAINKIDKPQANIEKTKGDLVELGLTPEEWGGKTVIVPISALKKQGIDELLDMVNLVTDIDPPKAVVDRPALGSVIESRLDRHVGPLASVLVHTGTLRPGDNITIGKTAGRIRRLISFRGTPLSAAPPSTPVTIVGLSDIPNAGDIMQVVEEQTEARVKASAGRSPVKTLAKTNKEDERPSLALVVKADSRGSLEALQQTIMAMVPKEVRLSLVRAEVGYVSDSDVLTAHAADALIYAFNTKVAGMAGKLAEKEKVPIRLFNVIYHLAEDIRQEIERRLPTEIVRHNIGKLKVLKVFFSSPKRKIVGGEVAQGKVKVNALVQVMREREKVAEGKITEMQREKRALEVASQGDQVGLTIEGKGKIKIDDVIDIIEEEKIKKTLTV